jgi:hypothetical protein
MAVMELHPLFLELLPSTLVVVEEELMEQLVAHGGTGGGGWWWWSKVGPGIPHCSTVELLTLVEVAVVETIRLQRICPSRRLWHRNHQIHNLTMDTKIYRLYGIDTAMHLLRPGAKWEISNSVITKWDDPRPQPSMEEVREVMDKIQAFEDSINTVWLPEQIEELTGRK